jgi:hypothetical protein
MARFVRFGFSMIAVAGLAACSALAAAPQSVVLDDFERVPAPGLMNQQFDPLQAIEHPTYPAHDFGVATSGYASVTSLSKQAAQAADNRPLYDFIQGQNAAQVRFTVPGDYTAPGQPQPEDWESGFGLTTESHTPLKVTDWSPYHYFDFEIYNPSPRTQTLYIRYNDAASALTVTSVVVPQGESRVELPLEQLSLARLDLADMQGVTLYLDTVGQAEDPVLMFDQLALYTNSSATRAKLALEEENGGDESDDQDWSGDDSDDSGDNGGVVRKVRLLQPGDALPASPIAPAAVSGGASAAPAAR